MGEMKAKLITASDIHDNIDDWVGRIYVDYKEHKAIKDKLRKENESLKAENQQLKGQLKCNDTDELVRSGHCYHQNVCYDLEKENTALKQKCAELESCIKNLLINFF